MNQHEDFRNPKIMLIKYSNLRQCKCLRTGNGRLKAGGVGVGVTSQVEEQHRSKERCLRCRSVIFSHRQPILNSHERNNQLADQHDL